MPTKNSRPPYAVEITTKWTGSKNKPAGRTSRVTRPDVFGDSRGNQRPYQPTKAWAGAMSTSPAKRAGRLGTVKSTKSVVRK